MSQTASRTDLTNLPEIGRVTAEELIAVGVPDAATLREIGAKAAFERIRSRLDPGACIQLLWGLTAAVEGVRVRELSPQTKADLRAWHRSLQD